jgi:virulence-associated protein VagC
MNEQPPRKSWTVKLERSGGDQIVRIPAEIALPGDHAELRRDGERVTIEAAEGKSFGKFLEHLRRLPPIEVDFPIPADPPPEDVSI